MSKDIEEISKYLNGVFKYDNFGQIIWLVTPDGNHQRFADLRGWGAIQNLFKKEDGTIDFDKAAVFQDQIGEWAVEALNNHHTRQKEGEWISVDESTPAHPLFVIMHIEGRPSTVGYYWEKQWYFANETEASIVTHWMPLPNKPKN